MHENFNRRDFLRLAGIGGVVFASALSGCATGLPAATAMSGNKPEDFFFVQLTDTHWGFQGPALNPDAGGTLQKAVAAVNALEQRPDFVVFTGDLTHTTDSPQVRRDRMKQFQDIVSKLNVKTVRFMPGEHDASLDQGEAFQQLFGQTHYTFDHKGVHFVAIDNVSDPKARVGDAQIAWLKADLAKLPAEVPVVVLTHRPLFDLYPDWDWATRDGAAVMDVLMPRKNVTVFYGHIHQQHHTKTAHIEHHAAESLIFPQPVPGSLPKRIPVAWDPAHPYKGLGFRQVKAEPDEGYYELKELPVVRA